MQVIESFALAFSFFSTSYFFIIHHFCYPIRFAADAAYGRRELLLIILTLKDLDAYTLHTVSIWSVWLMSFGVVLYGRQDTRDMRSVTRNINARVELLTTP